MGVPNHHRTGLRLTGVSRRMDSLERMARLGHSMGLQIQTTPSLWRSLKPQMKSAFPRQNSPSKSANQSACVHGYINIELRDNHSVAVSKHREQLNQLLFKPTAQRIIAKILSLALIHPTIGIWEKSLMLVSSQTLKYLCLA
jgi:hypothetical protein